MVNAWLIAFGGLPLLAGRLGDLLGRKGLFEAGLGAAGAGQGHRGVRLRGVSGRLDRAARRRRGDAVDHWHWIFFLNIPIGVVTALAAARLLDRDTGIGFSAGADIPGAVLITSALMLGVYTIVQPAAEDGWGSQPALELGAVAVALLVAFVVREARLAPRSCRCGSSSRATSGGANLIQVLSFAGMFGMFFLGALYLQRILRYDALETGLAFLPVTVVMGILSLRYSEKLIMRFGARTMLFPGLGLMGLALAIFTQAPVDGGSVQHVLPVMLLLGFGAGLCFPSLMTLAMSGATQTDAGLASGLVNTSAQVGGALGLAVLATVSSSRTEDLVASGQSTASALTGGYHLAFLIGAVLIAPSILVAATIIHPARRTDEAPTREEEAEAETQYA